MDFWSRLIGGSSTKKRPSNNPQERLARFKKVHNQILQTWQKASSLATDQTAIDNLQDYFQRITTILNDESRSPAPHLCLTYAASSHIFSAVSKIASTAFNESLVREAVGLFSALIDSEEEGFLENEHFADALMTFIGKVSGPTNVAVGEDTDGEIVELLFGIAAKIRLQPEILPVWFTTKTRLSREEDENRGRSLTKGKPVDFAGITQKEDFPLCYQLIDHVHHEGRIGDFARTGLLYIFESASKSQNLEQWIVESDLPTLMASGLGALYSQLSRKLSIVHRETELPIILALSDYGEPQASHEADNMYSPEFQVHMDTFLSYLTFWQDVLEHCRSIDVKETLIDHFRVLFLQQLLYPSLLESSDVDGGSSVAVLTYLRRILDALDHQELVHMILHYLLALPEDSGLPKTPISPVAIKRRASLMMLTQLENEDERLNPSLFNLVDLVLNGVQSRNSQTVIAALKLVTVILSKNHGYAVGTLLRTAKSHTSEPQRTIGALNTELESYLELAADFGGESGLDEAYESHLKDVLNLLEVHPCSARKLAPETSSHQIDYFTQPSGRSVTRHYLELDDNLMNSLITLLKTFFSNDVETNLSLIETIIALVSCAHLNLDPWFCIDPSAYRFSNTTATSSDPDSPFTTLYLARRRPILDPATAPPLFTTLQYLHTQLDVLRIIIPDLDIHLLNRKQAFRVHEDITDAIRTAPLRMRPKPTSPITETPPGGWTPQAQPRAIPAHVRQGTRDSSRASSPRGREGGSGEFGSMPRRLGSGVRSVVASPSRERRGGGRFGGSDEVEQERLLDEVVGLAKGDGEVLGRRVRFPLKMQRKKQVGDKTESETVRIRERRDGEEGESLSDGVQDGGEGKVVVQEGEKEDERKASVSHVLTNAIILQEFVLEIVAVLQIRASLFSEVRFG
ncbi:hypothetical protein M501DRAFT_1059701 [Patellaria atrata CBS 101060]|uniref:Retinoic acid induced 16-like protein-domain-containing protein n=1 Tax=Patellaria atrata CBS 101060 TaxID=1346257 RepID=A0A9P4VML2_9PEZI|nr:hypothetical protein M501DRAFT_1059701 [Patellaria atrata CBS 101060]